MIPHRALSASLLLSCLLPVAAAAQTTVPSRVELKGYGLSFDIPAGWTRVAEQGYSHLARLAMLQGEKAVGIMEIETLPSHGKTIGDLAIQLAARGGAKVIGERKVDACNTLEFRAPATGEMKAAGVTIFPLRDQFVMIRIGGPDDATVLESMRAVTTSMAFSEPQSADLDTQPRPFSARLFGSPLRLALPEAFRPAGQEIPNKRIVFAARNWANGRDEASVHIQAIPNPDGASLKDVLDAALPSIVMKQRTRDPIPYQKVSEKPEIYLTSMLTLEDGGVQRYAYVALEENRFATMIFGSNAADPAARERYMQMAENTCKAMRLAGQ